MNNNHNKIVIFVLLQGRKRVLFVTTKKVSSLLLNGTLIIILLAVMDRSESEESPQLALAAGRADTGAATHWSDGIGLGWKDDRGGLWRRKNSRGWGNAGVGRASGVTDRVVIGVDRSKLEEILRSQVRERERGRFFGKDKESRIPPRGRGLRVELSVLLLEDDRLGGLLGERKNRKHFDGLWNYERKENIIVFCLQAKSTLSKSSFFVAVVD